MLSLPVTGLRSFVVFGPLNEEIFHFQQDFQAAIWIIWIRIEARPLLSPFAPVAQALSSRALEWFPSGAGSFVPFSSRNRISLRFSYGNRMPAPAPIGATVRQNLYET